MLLVLLGGMQQTVYFFLHTISTSFKNYVAIYGFSC